MSNTPKLVTVFGGSGFAGRYIVRALAKRGYRIRVAVRRPDLAGFLQPLGNVGQIQFVQANLRYPASVESACEGADVVVNLVGILSEHGKQKFDVVQGDGAKAVATAAKNAGASLVHVSSLSSDKDSKSLYAQSKAKGEAAVRRIMGDAVIMRPSIMFGPEDEFFNTFALYSQLSMVLPAIGWGKTRFQPVYVGDVAEAVALAVDGKAEAGQNYELGGPMIATFKECLETMLEVINRRRLIVPLPWWVSRLMGRILGFFGRVFGLLAKPILTLDHVYLLETDNVVSDEAKASGLTLGGLGIQPSTMKAILPSYLVRFRPNGQYGGQHIAESND
jgi:NADH dehydrogenase